MLCADQIVFVIPNKQIVFENWFFIQEIIDRMIFDGEKLSDLLTPLDLSWRERTQKELDLMDDLIPLLKKLADGREIVGLNAYE